MKAYYKLLLGLITLLSLNNTFGATRYWVGGTGTWNNSSTTNWSASSGGAGGASAPTSSDDVVFDASSGLTGATVTTGTSAVCNAFTWSATVGTLSISSTTTVSGDFTWSGAGGTLSGSSNLYIAGSFTLNASMTLTTSGDLYFNSTAAGKTITTAGKTITSDVYFTGAGGGWTFQDNFTQSSVLYFKVQNGTVNTNNYTLTLSSLADIVVQGGTLNLGSSTVNFSSGSAYTITVSGGTLNFNSSTVTNNGTSSGIIITSGTANFGSSTISTRSINSSGGTIDFGTANITLTGGTSTYPKELAVVSGNTITTGTPTYTFSGANNSSSTPIEVYLGTKTLYNLTFSTGQYPIYFYDGGTVNNLTFATKSWVQYESVKTFTINGVVSSTNDCQTYSLFSSTTPGSAAVVRHSATQATLSYLQLRDIDNTGGTTFTCDYCVNSGTNTNITFTNTYVSRNLYWMGTGTGTGNWGTGTNWTTNAGGTSSGNTCVPTIVDNVFFDANSFDAASKTVTIDQRAYAANLNFTGTANSPAISNGSGYDIVVAGNLTLVSTIGTITNSGSVYVNGLAAQTVTCGTKTLTTGLTYFNNAATTTLADDGYFGSIYIKTGSTLDVATYDLYFSGDWYNYGTFNENTKTVYATYNSSNGSTCYLYTAETFYNLTVNKTGSTSYYLYPSPSGSSLTQTISNNLTVSSGTYRQAYSGTTNVAGSCSVNGTNAILYTSSGTFNWTNNSTTACSIAQGAFTVAGATVNIGTTNTHTTSVLNVGNSSGSGDATLNVSSGTLNIADKMYVQSDGIMNITGGTVNIKATTNNIGTATSKWVIDASGEFKQTSGTINVLGAYDNTSSYPAVAFNTSATTTAGNITGGTIVLQSTTTGVTTGYYVNWGGKTIYNLTSSTSGATYTQLTSAVTIKGTKTISSGVTYNANGLAISVAVNWTNNGTYTHNNNTVTFDGSAAQTLAGTSSTTFYGLTMNNTSATGVTIGINTTITNTITLTDGLLYTATYTLTLGTNSSNATVPAGSSASYIVAFDNAGSIGYIKQFVNSNTTYNFPLGSSTLFTPFTFTLNSNGGLTNANLILYTKATAIPGMNAAITQYIARHWVVTESGFTSPNYNASYVYDNTDIVGTETGLLPIKFSTTGWDWYKPTGSLFTTGIAQGTGSVNTGTNTLTWNNLTTFSKFGGAVDGAVALPVTLINFTLNKFNGNVKLNWKTANEINSDYFIIERSADGENFEFVNQISGAGNSNYEISYFTIDENFINSINYYRLTMVDLNNEKTYSPILSIDMTYNKGIIIKTVNSLGQEVDESCKGVVFDIYSDGTSFKRIQM